jgi:hypothetical protein
LHGFQFLVLDTIVSCVARFVDCFLILRIILFTTFDAS